MKTVAKKAIKVALNKLGYSVNEGERVVPYKEFYVDRYQQTLREMEAIYSKQFGLTLPERANRIDLMTDLLGTLPSEAFHILYHLQKAMIKPGDICEFGVAQGTTSAIMANEISDTNKRIWLFDSFKGLPMPTAKDELKDDIYNLGSMAAYAGTMACGLEMVTERLQKIAFPFERVKVVPGFIEETIKLKNLPEQVCFAYVDFDFYEPIKIALHFLDKVLSQGGYVVVDDYDWFSTGAKTAVDEFMNETQERYSLYVPEKALGCFAILHKQ